MEFMKKFGKYFVGKKVPDDYFPEASESEKIVMPWITIFAILGFIFLVAFDMGFNTFPGKYTAYALIFIPIGLLGLILNLAEMTKKRTPWGASSTFSGGYPLLITLAISIITALFFIIPHILGWVGIGVSFLSLGDIGFKSLFAGLLVMGLFIPIIENAFFAKYLVPSMYELGGKLRMAGIIGILIPSIIFMLAHFASTPTSAGLLFVFIFRFVTAGLILSTGSYLPALIPHMAVNSAFVISLYLI